MANFYMNYRFVRDLDISPCEKNEYKNPYNTKYYYFARASKQRFLMSIKELLVIILLGYYDITPNCKSISFFLISQTYK